MWSSQKRGRSESQYCRGWKGPLETTETGLLLKQVPCSRSYRKTSLKALRALPRSTARQTSQHTVRLHCSATALQYHIQEWIQLEQLQRGTRMRDRQGSIEKRDPRNNFFSSVKQRLEGNVTPLWYTHGQQVLREKVNTFEIKDHAGTGRKKYK